MYPISDTCNIKMLTLTVAITSFFIGACFGQAGQAGRYPDEYNLIDADPSCRYDIPSDVCCVSATSPQCPAIYNGAGDVDVMAIHPNIQERLEFFMRNMARLYPTFYASSEWGFGGGSYASDCDQPNPLPTRPFYFMSEAVQAARWNSFSGATTYSGCDRSGDHTCDDAQTSHYTCCDYCQYNTYGLCGYKYRTKGIVQLLFSANAWNDIGSEGIWCCNTAYQSSASHCGMVFNYEYEHQGIGYYPSGATTMVGIKDTLDWEDHVFPHSSHYDWDSSESYTFLVQFYGGKQTPVIFVDAVYLLYAGEMLEMEIVVNMYSSTRRNDTRDGTSGFYELVKDNTYSCEPYAFIAKDTSGTWWRLPENENYYFGTVGFPDDLIESTSDCNENHYYYTGSEWVANGADGLTNDKNSGNGCIGCSKIAELEAVYEDKDDDDDDDDDEQADRFYCNDGCDILIAYESDHYCDCSECEDEDDWDCDTCGNADGKTCDYIAEACGNWIYCDGEVDTPSQSPTGGTDDIPTTAMPTGSPFVQDATRFYCNDGCDIPTSYHNDGSWCDCGECEDEDNWSCDTCDDCDYISEECGNWMYCGTASSASSVSASGNTPDFGTNGDHGTSSTSDTSDTSDSDNIELYGNGAHTSETSTESSNDDNGIDTGLLIVLVCGAVVLVAIIIVALYCGCNKKKKEHKLMGMDDFDSNKKNEGPYKPPNGVIAMKTDDDIDKETQRVY